MRQRKDIEPAVFSGLAAYLSIGIKLVGWRGLVASCYSRLFACWILHGICLVVDHVLASIYGPGVSSQSVKTAHMNSTLEHLSSSIVIFYALGPLEDVAETVRYLHALNSTTESNLVTARYSIRFIGSCTPSWFQSQAHSSVQTSLGFY